jgi:hypothetical protein
MHRLQARFREVSKTRRLRLAAGTLFMGALAVTACSSGARTPTVATAAGLSGTPTTISQSHAMLLAVQCLRQHGIANLPDPTVVTSGPAAGQSVFNKRAMLAYPESVVNQALSACTTALDQAGVHPSPNSGVSQQEIQARLALVRCARMHGMPSISDPNPTTGEVSLPPGITPTSPQLLQAARACSSLLNAAGLTVPGVNSGNSGS